MSTESTRPVAIGMIAPSGVRPPCKIDPTAIISDKAVLAGSHLITIGPRSVLHPFAKLDSTNGPITLGSNCIVSERVSISVGNSGDDVSSIEIDDFVSIETGAVVEASRIGRCCTLGAYSTMERGVNIGQFCKISPKCTLPYGMTLPDFTVLFDDGQRRVDTFASSRKDIQDLKVKGQTMHIDTLKRLIPSNVAKWA